MEHCRLTFLYLLPLSDLFNWLCHGLLYLKHPNKSFFNPIKYILTSFTTLYLLFYNILFSFNVNFFIYSFYSKRSMVVRDHGGSLFFTVFNGFGLCFTKHFNCDCHWNASWYRNTWHNSEVFKKTYVQNQIVEHFS